MTHAIIFDCDGVLVDSEPISCTAGVATLEQNGIATDLSEIQTLIGKSYKELLDYYARRDGRPYDIPDFNQQVEANYFNMADGLLPMPGVTELLKRLTALRIPLVVASSGGYRKIEFSLEKAGLRDYFDIICSAVDVMRGKPEPDLFLYAAGRLEKPPHDCIVVEDSLYGVTGAKRAGMVAVGFPSSFPPEELLQAGADCLVADFTEFFTTLAGLGIRLGPVG